MSEMITARITAVGMYVPDKVLDNAYFSSILETDNEWIVSRTGIKERRKLEHGATSALAAGAAKDLIKSFNINPEEIDIIITCTVTPDMFFPSTTCLVQKEIGAKNAWGFDISAACSGFVFGMQTGRSFIQSGQAKKVLVIGADMMTAISDYSDRNTCILFGDAGGAVLLEPSDDPQYGIQDALVHCDGSGAPYLYMLGGGSLNPSSHDTVDKKMHYIYQDGKAVFKVAVIGMADIAAEIMEKNKLSADDVAYLVPHQANLRIIDATANRMGIGRDKVMINIDRYGNTTSATIPTCITEYYRAGKLKKGDKIILASFGAGFTWGSMYITWGID